jgi:hypothetical protein
MTFLAGCYENVSLRYDNVGRRPLFGARRKALSGHADHSAIVRSRPEWLRKEFASYQVKNSDIPVILEHGFGSWMIWRPAPARSFSTGGRRRV